MPTKEKNLGTEKDTGNQAKDYDISPSRVQLGCNRDLSEMPKIFLVNISEQHG
jgi:hypothetical protein